MPLHLKVHAGMSRQAAGAPVIWRQLLQGSCVQDTCECHVARALESLAAREATMKLIHARRCKCFT